MNQTLTIHYTGNFLSFHRWFLYLFEKALQTECGYKGTIPYWDWPKYVHSPQTSPIFNGDAYSMGGNGAYYPHNGTLIVPPAGVSGNPIQLPAGVGGGCVTQGPFTNITLGPMGLADVPVGPDNGYGSNPRCLKRDVGPAMGELYTNSTSVLQLLQTTDIEDFINYLVGTPYTPKIGPHGGGHFTINGDPGGDLFVSPGDPVFYLHHSQIDRLWTAWQNLDLKTRQNAIYGTNTWMNSPPSANTTLADTIGLQYAGPDTKIGNVMSTVKGPFCYIYE
jgi:tyrosinase